MHSQPGGMPHAPPSFYLLLSLLLVEPPLSSDFQLRHYLTSIIASVLNA